MELRLLEQSEPTATIKRRGRGVWRYLDAMPISDPRHIISLGEGSTPIVPLPRWGESIGVPRAMAKLEYFAPTGSFKDRGRLKVLAEFFDLSSS